MHLLRTLCLVQLLIAVVAKYQGQWRGSVGRKTGRYSANTTRDDPGRYHQKKQKQMRIMAWKKTTGVDDGGIHP